MQPLNATLQSGSLEQITPRPMEAAFVVTDVSDLADAHVARLDWLLAGKPSSSFNLGTERGFSLREVIRTEEITGIPITTEICPRRAGDLTATIRTGAVGAGK
jgi:UDP-glucose 4-epimerase